MKGVESKTCTFSFSLVKIAKICNGQYQGQLFPRSLSRSFYSQGFFFQNLVRVKKVSRGKSNTLQGKEDFYKTDVLLVRNRQYFYLVEGLCLGFNGISAN